jgi:hypothetical protein
MDLAGSRGVRTFAVSTLLLLTLIGAKGVKDYTAWERTRGTLSQEARTALGTAPISERPAMIDAAARLGLSDAELTAYLDLRSQLPVQASSYLDSLPPVERLRLVGSNLELQSGVHEGFQYHVLSAEGPLDVLDARNFGQSQYSGLVLADDALLFRAGSSLSNRGPLGSWLSFKPALSEAQARIDLAIRQTWLDPLTGVPASSNPPIDTVYMIRVPRGTTVYVGPVGSQGGIYLGGSQFLQAFVPDIGLIPGVDVVSSWTIP